MLEVKLHPKAQEDLVEALDYYTFIDQPLKNKFINDLDLTFGKIQKYPKLYPYETPTAQKVLLKKFPYIVLYEHFENLIMVLAIFHTKRHPSILDKRK